jgi:hypothetical protein
MAIEISKLRKKEEKFKLLIKETSRLKDLLKAANIYLREEIGNQNDF